MVSKNSFIVNGFDRSGTSAVSQTLATHPDIEIIMQPFNSGSIREKLYQVIDDSNATESDYEFFSKLERGILEHSYIKSEWHKNYSSVPNFVEGKVHLIKTTQNHLTINWVQAHFPGIDHWGIWRDPMDILASLVRNEFHTKWYSDAAPKLVNTVLNNDFLSRNFEEFIEHLSNPVREMAFIISVRSSYYFSHLTPERIIRYEQFVENNDVALTPVLHHYELKDYQFKGFGNVDLNIIGERYVPEKSYRRTIPSEDLEFCSRIFDCCSKLSNCS